MLKEKLGRIVSSKAFYIVFSILASVALWLFVEFGQNPNLSKKIENIPVVFINDDVLRDKGLVITNKNPETVTLTYEGNRSILPNLTSSSVSVTVDLSGITSTGYNPLSYRVVLPSDVNERSVNLTSRSVERISVNVDKLSEKTIEVKGKYDGGTVSDEYVAGTPEFNPSTIKIFGPDEVVSKIDSAWVSILRENLSATYIDELGFELQDVNGETVDTTPFDSFWHSDDQIRVTVPVRMVKEVTLTVNLMSGAGASDQNTRVTISPAKITLSGEPDIIRDFNSITLGTIDLTKIDLSDSVMFPIVLENNFANVSGETEAMVSVEVLGREILHFQTENIQVVNVPKGHTASIKTRSLIVRIRGSREEFSTIDPQNIRVVADLTNYSPGSAQIPAKVFIDGTVGDIGAVGDYKVTVTITKD